MLTLIIGVKYSLIVFLTWIRIPDKSVRHLNINHTFITSDGPDICVQKIRVFEGQIFVRASGIWPDIFKDIGVRPDIWPYISYIRPDICPDIRYPDEHQLQYPAFKGYPADLMASYPENLNSGQFFNPN